MKILMVLTSHAKLGNTDHLTGIWLEEFTSPYYIFQDAGATITLASPKGGAAPIDPASLEEAAATESTKRYDTDRNLQQALASTIPLEGIQSTDYDAIFYPGGHGPLWDLAEDHNSIRLVESFYAQGKPIGAVCHGVAVLKHPKSPQGKSIINGLNVTGFSTSEETAVKLLDIVPFLIEDMLKENGGKYSAAANWQSHVVRDGLLVTGQNPASSEETAHQVLQLLKA